MRVPRREGTALHNNTGAMINFPRFWPKAQQTGRHTRESMNPHDPLRDLHSLCWFCFKNTPQEDSFEVPSAPCQSKSVPRSAVRVYEQKNRTATTWVAFFYVLRMTRRFITGLATAAEQILCLVLDLNRS